MYQYSWMQAGRGTGDNIVEIDLQSLRYEMEEEECGGRETGRAIRVAEKEKKE